MANTNVQFNPNLTTNASGSFNVTSDGYIVGNAMPDPAARNWLSGGYLATTDVLPMWGGVGISENIPTPGAALPSTALGGVIGRATDISNLTGFSVFDQNYAGINSPQSPVPLTPGGGLVNFYRFGSNARVPLTIDPVLVSLEGGLITQQIGWNFDLQRICTGRATYATFTPTSVTVSGATATFVGTSMPVLPVGGSFVVASGALAGAWTVTTSSATALVATSTLYPTPGAQSATPIAAGGGYLPVRVVAINNNSSMAPVYSGATGFCTWNKNAAAALVLL